MGRITPITLCKLQNSAAILFSTCLWLLSLCRPYAMRVHGSNDVESNLVPRVRFSSCQYQEHVLWPLPKQEVHKPRTSGSSSQAI